MPRGPTWTPEQDAALTAAWPASNEAIGAQLGRSPQAVKARAHRLGLPPRERVRADRSDWTWVLVDLSPELLPAKGRRCAVIREGLALQKPHESPPPRDRVVLVRDVERPGFQALCLWDAGTLCWGLRWTPGGGETITPENWPESYRWFELPKGGVDAHHPTTGGK